MESHQLTTFTVSVKRLFALMVMLAALVLASCGAAATPSTTASAADTVTFDIELGDMYIKPASIDVPAGKKVILNVKNAGVMPHDVKIDGITGTAMLEAGASETVEVGPFTQSALAWCTVPGHRESGMELAINVIGAAATTEHTTTHDMATTATNNDGNAVIDAAAKPSA